MAQRERTGRAGKRLEAALRRRKVLNLCVAGLTEREIAEQVGLSLRRVERIISRALTELAEHDVAEIENVKALQLARIDRLVQALWPDAIGIRGDGTRKPPNMRAIAEIRKLEVLRGNIVGTFAAKRVDVAGTVAIEIPPDEIEHLERTWLESSAEDISTLEREPAPIRDG